MFIIDQYEGRLSPEFITGMLKEARTFRNKYGADFYDIAGALVML